MKTTFLSNNRTKYKLAPSGMIENFNKDTSDNDIIELLVVAIASIEKIIECKPFTFIWLNGTLKFMKSYLKGKKTHLKFIKKEFTATPLQPN